MAWPTRLPAQLMVVLVSLFAAGAAQAQCPDGTPPPCRAPAAAAPRRGVPPTLDERTWIVLPFTNVARAPDIDWLSDASVNLLYLDLSRWQDIHVIDDERVADFMREVPDAAGGQLGLQTGLAVARRAGAGKLVMGDLLKVGSRTAVVAKVFDVRTGQRLRSVREEAASSDSLMPAFGRLARGILDVAPPPGARGAPIGTTSVAAYREYLTGVMALNSWNLNDAGTRFRQAIALDSTFALAHYKLSVVVGWQLPTDPVRRAAAEAASRFSGSLPDRERGLIAGQLAQANDRWGEACAAYAALVRADSGDVDAWYNLGECNYHDDEVVAATGDTSRLAFRASFNTALRAFSRALDLDPTYHLAYAHIPDILQAANRSGCRGAPLANCRRGQTLSAVLLRDHDSLVTIPRRLGENGELMGEPSTPAEQAAARRANALLARDLAARWVAAGANEWRAHGVYGEALFVTGDRTGAERELALAARGARTVPERLRLFLGRIGLALKLDRPGDAALLADSLGLVADSAALAPVRAAAAVVGVTFGRFHRAELLPNPGGAGGTSRHLPALAAAFAGLVPDTLARIEEAWASQVTAGLPPERRAAASRSVLLLLSTVTFHFRRAGATLDSSSANPLMRFQAFLAAGDSSRARHALLALDSSLTGRPPDAPDDGLLLFAAESHLELGDSATALARMLEFGSRWVSFMPPIFGQAAGVNVPSSWLWGRAWLLLGDLAAAAGRPEEARRAYRFVVGLWEGGEAAAQPAVTRSREALARLGSE